VGSTDKLMTQTKIITQEKTQEKNNANTNSLTNNKKKFAFLSQETVPDYRPIEVTSSGRMTMQTRDSTDLRDLQLRGSSPPTEKSQKTNSNQNTKFQQIQQMFGNKTTVSHQPVCIFYTKLIVIGLFKQTTMVILFFRRTPIY
jgi:hypothetical protein